MTESLNRYEKADFAEANPFEPNQEDMDFVEDFNNNFDDNVDEEMNRKNVRAFKN